MTETSAWILTARESYALSYSELRVLVALAALRRVHGDAVASVMALAEVTGASQSAVRVALARLAGLGLAEARGSKVDRWHKVTRLGLARVAG